MSTSGTQPVAPSNQSADAAAILAALVESTTDIVWAVDLDYRLVAFNSAFAQHIAKSHAVQVAVGMSPHEILGGGAPGPSVSSYARALSEGRFVEQLKLLSGRTLELAYRPICHDGNVNGVSVFGKDITEREDAVKALQAAEARYRAIFEGAVLGIFRFNPDRSLSAANPALAEVLGYDSPEEFVRTITPARLGGSRRCGSTG